MRVLPRWILKKLWLRVVLFTGLTLLSTTHASDPAVPVEGRNFRMIRQISVPMRDGVKTAATIFLPREEGVYPVVLQRTPYNRLGWINGAEEWAKSGYIFICQDVRGRYDSEGEFDFLSQESNDTPDTVAWIRRQSWCNGKVGMMGPSYLGCAQFYGVTRGTGGENPDALIPTFFGGNAWKHGFYNGGPLSLFLAAGLNFECGARTGSSATMRFFNMERFCRHLPLRTMDVASGGGEIPLWRAFMEHPTYDDFWSKYGTDRAYEKFTMPTLIIGGWYDYYPAQAISQWAHISAAAKARNSQTKHCLLIGPWGHHHGVEPTKDGQRVLDFGPAAGLDEQRIYHAWFDRVFKGLSPTDKGGVATDGLGERPIRFFVMGRNVWKDADEWPPVGVRNVEYFLHSGGSSNTLRGDGSLSFEAPKTEPSDRFVYDPENPVPSHGGNHSVGPWSDSYKKLIWNGPTDRRALEERQDILVYSTVPLEEDLEVTGNILLKLWAASSACDTDFVGRLVDVHPDGRAVNITEGVVRARYREGDGAHPKLITPGEPLEYTIDLQATSNVFLKGHSVRLEVTSSNFPLWDRNLNNGEHPNESTTMKVATQTILHDAAHPTRLVLPVLR